MQETFQEEDIDLTDYFTSIAGSIDVNRGKHILSPEHLYDLLMQVTILTVCSEIITDIPEGFPAFLKKHLQKTRAKHMGDLIAQYLTPEKAQRCHEWKQMFTTMVWVLCEDEEFTSLFEQYTEIPYQDSEEALV